MDQVAGESDSLTVHSTHFRRTMRPNDGAAMLAGCRQSNPLLTCLSRPVPFTAVLSAVSPPCAHALDPDVVWHDPLAQADDAATRPTLLPALPLLADRPVWYHGMEYVIRARPVSCSHLPRLKQYGVIKKEPIADQFIIARSRVLFRLQPGCLSSSLSVPVLSVSVTGRTSKSQARKWLAGPPSTFVINTPALETDTHCDRRGRGLRHGCSRPPATCRTASRYPCTQCRRTAHKTS